MRRHFFFLWLSILSLWIGMFGQMQTAKAAKTEASGERIPLTPEEEAWISAHPVIRAGHDARIVLSAENVSGFNTFARPDESSKIIQATPSASTERVTGGKLLMAYGALKTKQQNGRINQMRTTWTRPCHWDAPRHPEHSEGSSEIPVSSFEHRRFD